MKRLLFVALCAILAAPAWADENLPFDVEEITSFDQPWALAFLPDGRMLVTEKKGALRLVSQDGETVRSIRGLPDADYRGQGGFGDVALHPDFEDNGLIYVSYVEAGVGNTRGAAVARGILTLTERGGSLSDVDVIWRQYPKLLGAGHYGHRILFDDEGYLWISSGDRQKFTPSQDMQSNVGKIVRLYDDGAIPHDNPFVDYHSEDPNVDDEGIFGEIWSLGHRNPLGIAKDQDNQVWVVEMGPAHGDELNRIVRGANYGYPVVSNGDHYDGREMPDHETHPEFAAPAAFWVPAISPGALMFYDGDLFSDWAGNAFVSGLGSEAIIRIEIDGETAQEVERFEMNARIRSIAQGPEGALWVLEDEYRDSKGRLLKLTPKD